MDLTPDSPCPDCGAHAGEFCLPTCSWRTSIPAGHGTCVACGVPVAWSGRRPRRWCSASCRLWAGSNPGQPRPLSGSDRRCQQCREPLAGRNYRFCSASCRQRSTSELTPCVACGETFEAEAYAGSRERRTTCSVECMRRLQREGSARGGASPHQRRLRTCSDCPTLVLAPRKRCDQCRAPHRAEQMRANKRRRRAAKRGGTSEPYTLAQIAARDGNRCQLCRRTVNMTLAGPHPKAPSIDHVVPLVEGGDDTRANVQLAHFGCNSSKGVRGSQQLALVG